MIRRDFLTLLGATAVWPLAGHAQQTKMHRIGALLLGNADAESFRNGTAAFGGKAEIKFARIEVFRF